MSNFCNGLTFVVFKGYKLGCLVCTPDNPKLLGVLTYVWVLVGNIKVESKVSLVIWFSGIQCLGGLLMKSDEISDFLENEWKYSCIYLSALMGFWERKIIKVKFYCALLNFNWFHLTGKVPVLINFLKFSCVLWHTGQ